MSDFFLQCVPLLIFRADHRLRAALASAGNSTSFIEGDGVLKGKNSCLPEHNHGSHQPTDTQTGISADEFDDKGVNSIIQLTRATDVQVTQPFLFEH